MYGYPSELFKLDMERLGIAAKRKPAKVIDFAQYIEKTIVVQPLVPQKY